MWRGLPQRANSLRDGIFLSSTGKQAVSKRLMRASRDLREESLAVPLQDPYEGDGEEEEEVRCGIAR